MNDAGVSEPEWRTSEQALAARWDEECQTAEEEDHRYDSAATWVPPIKGALLRAARATSLRRLYPFSAMNQVCFSSRRDHWEDARSIAPGFVALGGDGHYFVGKGFPYSETDRDVDEVLSTDDAVAAADALAELLNDWRG